MKNDKRIHTVTIKHETDMDDRGESTIGTFDNEAKSEYAIPVEHCYGYRYEGFPFYNAPVENYLGESPEDIRKYVQQDYERMQSYQAGAFDFIGIRAIAKVQLEANGPFQQITSGEVWGIESDSDASYLADIEQEQLSELRQQLHAIGFSNRAISAAFKNVERGEL